MVTAQYINTSSKYGAPQTDSTQTPIGNQTNTYDLSTDRPAICNIKTLEMSLTNNAPYCRNDWVNRHNCVYSQGYNPQLFDKTNAPITLSPFVYDGNKRYSRDADKTVMGEWGVLTDYPDSNFAFLGGITSIYKDIWSSALNKTGYQFSVQVQTGVVRSSLMTASAYPFAACKK